MGLKKKTRKRAAGHRGAQAAARSPQGRHRGTLRRAFPWASSSVTWLPGQGTEAALDDSGRFLSLAPLPCFVLVAAVGLLDNQGCCTFPRHVPL